MSQATNLYTRLRFADKTYNHKYEVEQDLENVRERRERVVSDLKMLAFMTEPEKFCNEETPEWYLKNKVMDLVEELEDCSVEEYKLSILLDRWDDCHLSNGLGIEPSTMIRNSTFIDGDFVLTDAHPTQESLIA